MYNGASVLGSELGAALTSSFGVTESSFDGLAPLVTVCTLSSLLPLPLIGWVSEVDGLDDGDADDASTALVVDNESIDDCAAVRDEAEVS